MPSPLASEYDSMLQMDANAVQRERIKAQLQADTERSLATQRVAKAVMETRWSDKYTQSPLNQNLVEESDRLGAEARILEVERHRLQSEAELNKASAIQTLTAALLADTVDEVKALREQRRRIEAEEKRLKALMGVEKAKLVTKDNYFAAKQALKQRRDNKLKARRTELEALQKVRIAQEKAVAKMGVGLAPPPTQIIVGLRNMYGQSLAMAAVGAGGGGGGGGISTAANTSMNVFVGSAGGVYGGNGGGGLQQQYMYSDGISGGNGDSNHSAYSSPVRQPGGGGGGGRGIAAGNGSVRFNDSEYEAAIAASVSAESQAGVRLSDLH